jgi:hypothetical protein
LLNPAPRALIDSTDLLLEFYIAIIGNFEGVRVDLFFDKLKCDPASVGLVGRI